jgi:hypothetical protein
MYLPAIYGKVFAGGASAAGCLVQPLLSGTAYPTVHGAFTGYCFLPDWALSACRDRSNQGYEEVGGVSALPCSAARASCPAAPPCNVSRAAGGVCKYSVVGCSLINQCYICSNEFHREYMPAIHRI